MADNPGMGAKQLEDVHLVVGTLCHTFINQNLSQFMLIIYSIFVSLCHYLEAKGKLWELESAKVCLRELLNSEAVGGGAPVDLHPVYETLIVFFVYLTAVVKGEKILNETVLFWRSIATASILSWPMMWIYLRM